MKKKNVCFVSAALVLSVWGLSTSLAPYPSPQQQGGGKVGAPPPTKISDLPSQLMRTGMSGFLRQGYQSGQVILDAITRTVEVHWRSDLYQNLQPNSANQLHWATKTIGNSVMNQQTQKFSVSFFPTSCAKIDNNSILVAGVKPSNGGAIIQKWSFSWQAALPSPFVNASGYDEVSISLPTLSKSIVHNGVSSSLAPRKYISGISSLKTSVGSITRAIVQFQSPSDLVLMELSNGAMTLLASAVDPTGTFGIVDSLSAADFNSISPSDHIIAGYVYRFFRGSPAFASSNAQSSYSNLLFFDGNRDGTLDSQETLTTSQFEAQGYNLRDSYSNWWLE